MKGFHERSRKNITGVTQTRERPGGFFLSPVGVHLGAKRGAATQPLTCAISFTPRVAIVDMNKTKACPAKQCTIVHGPHRCADVELAVVPDLAMLHDEDLLSSDVDLAVSFLYIVSLGVLTTTTAQLAAVGGIPRHLTPQRCVRHVSASMEENVTFCVGGYLLILFLLILVLLLLLVLCVLRAGHLLILGLMQPMMQIIPEPLSRCRKCGGRSTSQ